MFNRIRRRLHDMGTIKALCERAEQYALQDQQREPGAEHFLLSALDLPDGTARRTFEHVGADPSGLAHAIARQYTDALCSVGLDPEIADRLGHDLKPLPRNRGLYSAAPSGEEVMQKLAAERKRHGPLLGAHVVAVVAQIPEGVAARSFRAMGIKPDTLRSAAEAEIGAHSKTDAIRV